MLQGFVDGTSGTQIDFRSGVTRERPSGESAVKLALCDVTMAAQTSLQLLAPPSENKSALFQTRGWVVLSGGCKHWAKHKRKDFQSSLISHSCLPSQTPLKAPSLSPDSALSSQNNGGDKGENVRNVGPLNVKCGEGSGGVDSLPTRTLKNATRSETEMQKLRSGLLDFLFPCFLQRLPLLAPPITDDLLKAFADVTIVCLYSQYFSVKAEKLYIYIFLFALPSRYQEEQLRSARKVCKETNNNKINDKQMLSND